MATQAIDRYIENPGVPNTAESGLWPGVSGFDGAFMRSGYTVIYLEGLNFDPNYPLADTDDNFIVYCKVLFENNTDHDDGGISIYELATPSAGTGIYFRVQDGRLKTHVFSNAYGALGTSPTNDYALPNITPNVVHLLAVDVSPAGGGDFTIKTYWNGALLGSFTHNTAQPGFKLGIQSGQFKNLDTDGKRLYMDTIRVWQRSV